MKSTRSSVVVAATSESTNGLHPGNSVAERIMKMKKWREERDKKRAVEKANKKPIFRASIHVEIPSVIAINSDWRTLANKSHKFKAPANIKPIAFQYGAKKSVEQFTNKSLKTSEKSIPMASNKLIREMNHNLHGENKEKQVKNALKDSKKIPGLQISKLTKVEDSSKGRITRQSLRRQESSDSISNNKENIGKELVINEVKSKKVMESAGKIPEKVTKTRKSLRVLYADSKSNDNIQLIEKFDVKVSKTQRTSKTPRTNERRSVGRPTARCLTQNKKEDAKNLVTVENKEQYTSVDGQKSEASLQYTTEEEEFYTPENKATEPIVYVSPFVTMSRGKKCARSEYKLRASKGGEQRESLETNVKSGAAYFYKLLNDEIARINRLCDHWEEYKTQENLPEEAMNMINVPIGQSNLLISKKMQQFRALIDKSVHSTDNLSVTSTDLHGFWDTVMIQVRNLDKRFDNLDTLRSNHWEEVLPRQNERTVESSDEPSKPKRIMPKRGVKKANEPVSKIRDAIRAAKAGRNKQVASVQQEGDGLEFNGGFFSIKSPVKTTRSSPIKTPKLNHSMSLLKSVLNSKNKKSIKGSPGLAMMKASNNARLNGVSADGNLFEVITPLKDTPTKSILKLSSPKSSVKKTVAFNDSAVESLIFEPLEYDDE